MRSLRGSWRRSIVNAERPCGHDEVLEGLWGAARAERLPHALLFSGGEGIGKFMAARWFLAGMFCEEGPGEPCGSCGACRRLQAGSFGDLLLIEPGMEGAERIKLGRIARRDEDGGVCLEEFLGLRAVEGGWRGVILRDAERATREAQNALLKTLEEPGEACCLILVSAHPGRLLETVRSRCVQVGLVAPELGACAEVLARAGYEAEIAGRVSRWAGGAPGRALAWARRGVVAERGLLLGILGGELDALQGTSEVLELEGELGEGTPSVLVRRRAVGVVELGVEVLRDLARLGAGVAASELAHGDVPQEIASRARVRGVTRAGLEVLWRARGELDSHLAPEAVLDRALSELQEIFVGARAPVGGR